MTGSADHLYRLDLFHWDQLSPELQCAGCCNVGRRLVNVFGSCCCEAKNQNRTTPAETDFITVVQGATLANPFPFKERAFLTVPVTDQPTIAVGPSNDGMVISHAMRGRHAKQVGGGPANRERFVSAQRCSLGRIISQHQLGGCGTRHRRLHRCHHCLQSSMTSAQNPGSPSRHASTRPGNMTALAANASAIRTIASRIHPGIAPGQRKAVERDTDRKANVAIVRATHSLNGVQGSRLGFNAGNILET